MGHFGSSFWGLRMIARVHCIAAFCCVALVSGAHETAFAADMPPAPVYKAPPPVVVNPWTFDITPYAWLPSLNGSSTIKGHITDIDATFFGDLIHSFGPDLNFYPFSAVAHHSSMQ